MAARDAQFNRYLIDALRSKVTRYPQATSYRSIDGKFYFDYDFIFYSARRVFAKYNNARSVNLSSLPKEERDKLNFEFAKNIVQNVDGIQKDKELLQFLDDKTAPTEPEEFHKEVEQNLIKEPPAQAPPPKPPETTTAQTQKPLKPEKKEAEEPQKQAEEKQEKDEQPKNEQVRVEQKPQPSQPPTFPKPVQPLPGVSRAPRFGRREFFRRASGNGQVKPKAAQAAPKILQFAPRFTRTAPMARPTPFIRQSAPMRVMRGVGRVAGSTVVRNVGAQAGIGVRKVSTRLPGFLGGFLGNTGKQALSIFGINAGGVSSGSRGGSGGPRRIAGGSGGGGGRLGNLGRGIGSVAKGGGKKWLLLLLLLLFIGFLFFMLPQGERGIKVFKAGPEAVDNGKEITYTISVINEGTGSANVRITDNIPNNTEFVRGSNNPQVSQGKVVTWNLRGVIGGEINGVSLTVRPTKDDVWIVNKARAEITNQGLSPPTGVFTGGAGCPDVSTNKTAQCKYLNPSIGLFDTDITSEALDSYVSKYSPVFINAGKGNAAEFRRRVDYIVETSREAGINPAILLGLWRSENAFGTTGSREMGCAGSGFEEEVHCALGIREFSNPVKNPIANCARSRDAESAACKALKSIRTQFDKSHPIQYPISTIDDFMEAHGPYDDLTGGLPTNCMNTYNIIVEVAEQVGMCKEVPLPAPAPGTGTIGFGVSCPLSDPSGAGSYAISCGSAASPVNSCGHGGIGYGACTAPPYAVCPYSPQLKSSIDVKPTRTQAPVYAPYMNGNEKVTWRIIQRPIAINGGSWGYKIILEADYQGKKLTLDLTHINQALAFLDTVQSGELIGSVYPNTDGDGIGHLHTALAVDGTWVDAIKDAALCTK